MPVSVARLRRWFVGALVFVCLVVGGTYLYFRHRVTNALKQVPGKIGLEIQQSAQGFTISKSEQGRTLFKLQASKAVQYKQGGRVELHDVSIALYGRDSSRFDQVYGQDFEYDQQSGNVTSLGEVAIDLQANPQGLLNADQASPKELKNPIHLKTTQLVFNQKTGDAWTPAEVDFSVPQANGSAVGARYSAHDNGLTLQSQVRIVMSGAQAGTLHAAQAVLEKSPREIVLKQVRAESSDRNAQADELTLFLRDDNTLDHAEAMGNVKLESAAGVAPGHTRAGRRAAPTRTEVAAERLEVHMDSDNVVQSAVLSGDVKFGTEGPQTMQASAGRAAMSFGAKSTLTRIHAENGVKLIQSGNTVTQDGRGRPSLQNQIGYGLPPGSVSVPESEAVARSQKATPQDVEVTAPAMDLYVADGQRLTRAETIGPPQVTLSSSDGKQAGPTRITADKFVANFDSFGQLSQVHGESHARVVSATPALEGKPQPDRASTSDSIDASFLPGRGIVAIVQKGHFTYTTGTQQAFADNARYTPADQMVTLSGSPRILDTGMETTARSIRMNRGTGEGLAQGDVKTSYSDLKPQPGGALLASSDPIHVTAESMTAKSNPLLATYTGKARLWQNANVVQAPAIQFQKDNRIVVADSSGTAKVSTVLVGTDKKGNATPVTIQSNQLSYQDSERKAHFSGGVTVRSTDMTITAEQMDVLLAAAPSKSLEGQASVQRSPAGEAPAASQSKLEKIIASGSVVITEPNRRATGQRLTYTALDDKFVLTGGPPCIFDAEHGKITGVSLTLFRRDARVVMEGDSSSPAVTQTRVVR